MNKRTRDIHYRNHHATLDKYKLQLLQIDHDSSTQTILVDNWPPKASSSFRHTHLVCSLMHTRGNIVLVRLNEQSPSGTN